MSITWERGKNASIISLQRQLEQLQESTQHGIAQVAADDGSASAMVPQHNVRARVPDIFVSRSPAKYYPPGATPATADSTCRAEWGTTVTVGPVPRQPSPAPPPRRHLPAALGDRTNAAASAPGHFSNSAKASHATAHHGPSSRGPGQPSAFERSRHSAVLLMERQLQQLQQEVQESRGLRSRQADELAALQAHHEQQLRDAQGAAGEKLTALRRHIAELMDAARRRRLLQSVLQALSGYAQQQRRLRSCGVAWARRRKQRCLMAWHGLVEHARVRQQQQQEAAQALLRTALRAWRAQQQLHARHRRLLAKAQHQRLARLLAAWRAVLDRRLLLRRQLRHAERWHARRLVGAAFWHWRGRCQVLSSRADALCTRRQECLALRALEAWHLLASRERRAERMGLHCRLRTALRRWQTLVLQSVQLAHLRHMRRQRLLAQVFAHWAGLGAQRRRLAAAGRAFVALAPRWHKLCVLKALQEAVWEARAGVHMARWRQRRVLEAWGYVAARLGRERRLMAVRRARAAREVLRRCMEAWRLHAVVVHRRRLEEQHLNVQAQVQAAEDAHGSAVDRAAAASHRAEALVHENCALQGQVLQSTVGALEGLQFQAELQWRSLPGDPGAPTLPPRSRHATVRLEALQQQDWAANGGLPGLCGSVVVFGGVSGTTWLTDVHVLTLVEDEQGAARVECAAAEVSNADAGADDAGGEGSWVPEPVRDFAACACGPDQFVVVGGFDGQQETLDLHLCSVSRRLGDADWYAQWRAVTARNQALPLGRSHHSVCHYAEGRSLVVFGGVWSARGCLNDLWLFHLHHMEWWQPETTGDPPPHRRSHVAAILGHKLLLHGGYNGQQHLGDTWECDLLTWHWRQLASVGVAPLPRRGHAVEAVGGRYVLVQGGYDGERHLADAFVLDTRTSTWLAVDLQGAAAEWPVPRALHTITLLGSRLLVLGGSGPLGPLGDVHLLESPAVQRGVRLQAQQLAAQAALARSQGSCAELDAQLACSRREARQKQEQLLTLQAHWADLEQRHSQAVASCSLLSAKLEQARHKGSAAEAEAALAAHVIADLKRRLERARSGGRKAVHSAAGLEDRLAAAEAEAKRLQDTADASAQQVTALQLQLAQHASEAALMRAEVAEAQRQARAAARASQVAQSDYRRALDRGSLLHRQEVAHVQAQLEAARRTQQQLQEQLGSLQGQSASEAAAAVAAAVANLEQQQQQQQQQFQQQLQQQMLSVPALRRLPTQGEGLGDAGSESEAGWQLGPLGDSSAMPGERALAAAAEGGRAQAWVEALQERLAAQQGQMEVLRSEVAKERTVASHARDSAARALQQLQAAEQEHAHTVQALEMRLRDLQWALWQHELQGAAAGQNAASSHEGLRQVQHSAGQADHVPGSRQQVEPSGTARTEAEAAGVEWAAAGDAASMASASLRAGAAGASTPDTAYQAHLGRQQQHETLDVSGADGSFTIHLSSMEHEGDLELLPEVHKLMLLHRQLLGSDPITLHPP